MHKDRAALINHHALIGTHGTLLVGLQIKIYLIIHLGTNRSSVDDLSTASVAPSR